jgi:DNA polymerase III delta prime subunit
MGLIRKISSEFEERSKLFLVTLIISLVSVFLAYFLGGFIFAIAIVLPCLSIFLTVSKDVWSSDSGQTKVAIFSIAAILALVIGTIHPALAKTLLEPLYEIPLFKDFVFIITPSLPVMIIASLAIVVINFALRDRTAMNKHRSPLEKEFPAPEYKDRLKGFCRVLKDNLDRVEREGNWSAELFVPLDAEVEIRGVGEISKKKQDLLSALKKEKNVETFLVIGQPGSGKSVALRKLCRELLSEVKETGKVPVYINLKEWSTYVWSRDNPPTMDNFHEFVLQNIKNQGDRFTTDFLTVYFDRMVETGRLFFIFDSFDEIPALLENEDAEWLLDEISKIIHRYLTGGHLSRGILATRPYKRPSNQFISGATIHILPLSEQRISDVLAKYPSVSHDSIREILTTRRDLLPIAKNPFYCALIVNFLQDNNGQMPLNRAELFQSYIAGRLFDCRDRIEQNGLLNEEIEYACEQVAELMFNSERFGFEIPIRELKNDLVGIDEAALEKVIDVLVFSKIGRHSGSDKTLFTFSHKRFAEYFVVQTILGSYSPELLVDIHNDGKWRDVIVLLAELEDEERSSAIASYAWTKLVETHNLLIKRVLI